jgi:general stress protein YciG
MPKIDWPNTHRHHQQEITMATGKGGNKQSGGRGGQGGGTSNRGFASMDPERQREIASEGGKAAHEKGTAHEFTSEEARRAGSMSHGNRQSEQASSRSGGSASKKGGNKQGGQAENEQGMDEEDEDSGKKR